MSYHYVRYQAARQHIQNELERKFREQFWDNEKSQWKHSSLVTTITLAKKTHAKAARMQG